MTAISQNRPQTHHKKGRDSIDLVQSMPAMECQSKPIWKVITEMGSQIPDEEWKKIPDDASINLKHYLYGEPNKNA